MSSLRPDNWTPFDEMLADAADPRFVAFAEARLSEGLDDGTLVVELCRFMRAEWPHCPHRRTAELSQVTKWVARKRHLDSGRETSY